MTDPDIVARLRLTPVLIRRDSLGQSVIDYEACKKYVNEEGVKLMREAADEIERLRKERDEARREVCRGEAMLRLQRNRVHRESEEVVRMAKEIAVERGWDCFKENTDV